MQEVLQTGGCVGTGYLHADHAHQKTALPRGILPAIAKADHCRIERKVTPCFSLVGGPDG